MAIAPLQMELPFVSLALREGFMWNALSIVGIKSTIVIVVRALRMIRERKNINQRGFEWYCLLFLHLCFPCDKGN